MANQLRAVKRQAPLSNSLRLLLNLYLEELLKSYLAMAEEIKVRQGKTAWNFLLFEIDVTIALDLMENRPAIVDGVVAFFEKHKMPVSKQKGFSNYLVITVDLEKRLGLLTEQLCLTF